MKIALSMSAAFSAALLLAACGERNEVVEDGPVENASSASGVGSNPASNAVQDATSTAVGAAAAATAGRTTGGFVTNAAISDMYEIEAGKIAQEKGQSADVKAFGKMMVAEHTKMSADMKTAAASAGADATVPTALDERRQGMIDNLKQAPADGFDKIYLAQQTAAHDEALTLAKTYADNGDNAALKAFAVKGQPMIQKHLDRARQLEGGAGAGANAGAAAPAANH